MQSGISSAGYSRSNFALNPIDSIGFIGKAEAVPFYKAFLTRVCQPAEARRKLGGPMALAGQRGKPHTHALDEDIEVASQTQHGGTPLGQVFADQVLDDLEAWIFLGQVLFAIE